MLVRIIRRVLKPSFSFSSGDEYIPVRPLREQSNVLFSLSKVIYLPMIERLFISTPFIAFVLEGLINQWTIITSCGSIVSFLLSMAVFNYMHYYKATQVHQLACNRNLNRFELTLTLNHFTLELEENLLKTQQKTYEQYFMEKLKTNSFSLSQEVIEAFK